MVWCIESVNERASLAPEPAQEWGGSLQPAVGGGCTKEKGEREAMASHSLSRSDLLGWQKPRSIYHLCPALH